jgi:MFS family permease
MSPIASSIVAPAAFQMAQDLHITKSIEVSMIISIYVLAYGEHWERVFPQCFLIFMFTAVGPLFLSPLSEIYGRARVLQLANSVFLSRFLWTTTTYVD